MKAIRVLAMLLAVLAVVGCGKKVGKKVVAEKEIVAEKKVVDAKNTVVAEKEAVAEMKVVDVKNTIERGGLKDEISSETPFTREAENAYRDGKEEGKWTYRNEDGQKWLEGEYRDGKEEGKWTEWYQNGQKKQEVEFRGGVRVSIVEWDENGNLKK